MFLIIHVLLALKQPLCNEAITHTSLMLSKVTRNQITHTECTQGCIQRSSITQANSHSFEQSEDCIRTCMRLCVYVCVCMCVNVCVCMCVCVLLRTRTRRKQHLRSYTAYTARLMLPRTCSACLMHEYACTLFALHAHAHKRAVGRFLATSPNNANTRMRTITRPTCATILQASALPKPTQRVFLPTESTQT